MAKEAVKVAEVEQLDTDGDLDAGFKEGLASRGDSPKEPEVKAPVVQADPPKDPKAEEAVVAQEDDNEPVTLTRAQFKELMSSHEDGKKLRSTLDKLSGTLGAQRQEIDSLKKTTSTLEITDADFEELVKEFPEIGAGVKKGFGSILKRLVGIAPPKGAGEDDIKKAIFNAVNARENEVLEDEFPDWREIVGKKDNPDHPFRKWLEGQTPQYKEKVTTTFSANVLTRAIKRFQADNKKEVDAKAVSDREAAAAADRTKASNDRTGRLRAAVQPRGDGGGTATSARKR